MVEKQEILKAYRSKRNKIIDELTGIVGAITGGVGYYNDDIPTIIVGGILYLVARMGEQMEVNRAYYSARLDHISNGRFTRLEE